MLLHIIGGHCKLATMTSRRRPWPGDKLAVAGRPDGNKPVDGSQRARRQLPRARSLFSAPFPFPPATNYGLGEERRCSPDPEESRTPRTHSRSRPARSHSRTATYQTKPTIASSGPVVSQSPSLLRERAPKQQPSPPLLSSPLPSSTCSLFPHRSLLLLPSPFYTASPARRKASPLSAPATRPSLISESRSGRSGLFSSLWWLLVVFGELHHQEAGQD